MNKPGLSKVSDVCVHDAGASVSLRLENESGERFDMALSAEELTHFIESLIDLGISAARTRTEGRPVSLQSSPPSEFSSNEMTGMAVGETADRQALLLVLRLFDFDLSFTSDRSMVFSLAESFSQMAAELRAEESGTP